jgi:hypothetical protein
VAGIIFLGIKGLGKIPGTKGRKSEEIPESLGIPGEFDVAHVKAIIIGSSESMNKHPLLSRSAETA